MSEKPIDEIRAAIQELAELARLGQPAVDIASTIGILASALVELDYLRRDRTAIEAMLDKEEKRTHCGYAGKFSDRVDYVIAHYRNMAEKVLENSKDFRNDTANWLRAMRIVADSVGNASTHVEKGARLRGMVEILDWAVNKLDSLDFTLQWARDWPDLWRSDYPTRQYVERIYELEHQMNSLRKEAEEKGAGG